MARPLAANSLLLPILERLPQHFASGDCAFVAPCPTERHAHASTITWLVLAETLYGVSIACLGACSPAQVLLALKLPMDDLYPESMVPASARERAEALRFTKEWRIEAVQRVLNAENALAKAATLKLATEDLSDAEELRLTIGRDVARQAMEWGR